MQPPNDLDFVAREESFEAGVVDDGKTTHVAVMRRPGGSRLGTHAIAAVFVILLAAFGVFCNYYPWKLPAASMQEVPQANAPIALPVGGPTATRVTTSARSRNRGARSSESTLTR